MAESLFVRYFEHRCLIGKMENCVANYAVLTRQDVIDPSIGKGRADLETGWLLCRHHIAWCVKPKVVLADETLIGNGEDGEACLIRCRIAR